jgi:hypothetical protein
VICCKTICSNVSKNSSEIFKQSIHPFIFLEGQEGEAIMIAITGLIETVWQRVTM